MLFVEMKFSLTSGQTKRSSKKKQRIVSDDENDSR
jgi:hypothetical protein